MELGDLNLDGLEKSVYDLQKWVIPSQHVVLLKKATIKVTLNKSLGFVIENIKPWDTKKKSRNDHKGRISNQ